MLHLAGLVLLISTLVTLCITPVVRILAIYTGVLDAPNERKIHTSPIPRLGGFAIYLGCMVAVTLTSGATMPFGIIMGSTIIISVGILDDMLGMNAWVKLSGQLMAAAATVWGGVSISFLTSPFHGFMYLKWLAMPITVIWIVGIINTLNLIDGTDGLAAGVGAISSGILAFVAFQTHQYNSAFLLIALLGSCLGFLRYNFAPAKIFMGDSGSMFLGYMLATTSIMGVLKSTMTLSLFIPILVLGVPISDTAITICRRIKNKKAIFQADKGHLHHHLLAQGLSHKQVAALVYACSLVLGLIAIGLSLLLNHWILASLILIPLTIGIILFMRKFQKHAADWLSFFS